MLEWVAKQADVQKHKREAGEDVSNEGEQLAKTGSNPCS
ncbi:MAG: hypothetical protein OJF49_000024 [Ktedonobacterales bacterium]|nr:MAG: hypothetical protein OJF49_000024 [Ktedonobacterales bacterium]